MSLNQFRKASNFKAFHLEAVLEPRASLIFKNKASKK